MKFAILFIWMTTILMTLSTAFLFLDYRQTLAQSQKKAESLALIPQNNTYRLYASLPKVLGETTLTATTEDAVPTLVKNYLAKNKSPMSDSSDYLVSSARKYGIDPLLMVAIAQCESNLGKKMPAECYNPFGWGIHSEGRLCFENWAQGYEVVAKGLKEKYLNKGLNTPQEIMTKYNLTSILNSDGSWAKCVDKFLNEVQIQN